MSVRHSLGSIDRRMFLIGTAATAVVPFGLRRGGDARLSLGIPDGLDLDDGAVRAAAAAAFGCDVTIVRFASPASLRDHFAGGAIQAAVLPRHAPLPGGEKAHITGIGAWERRLAGCIPLPLQPVIRATLLLGPHAASHPMPVVGRAVADPTADAALGRLLAGHLAAAPACLTLAPAQLAPNTAAGQIEAALVFGPVDPAPGVTLVRLAPRDAAGLRPRLVLVRNPFAEA